MSAQHTPGPWRIDPSFQRDVQTADGKIEICTAEYEEHKWDTDFETPQFETEGLANARLISAAPELLEALEAVYEHINGGSGIKIGKDFNEMWEQCRAVIAKAKGE